MIWDYENMFYHKKAIASLGAASDVVANGGGGAAYEAPFLAVNVAGGATSAALTVKLQHADTATGTFADVATYTVPADATGDVLAARLPAGLKKFLRLACTGTQSGNAVVTAGLVLDVNMKQAE